MNPTDRAGRGFLSTSDLARQIAKFRLERAPPAFGSEGEAALFQASTVPSWGYLSIDVPSGVRVNQSSGYNRAMNEAIPTPNLRWLRFGLRTFFVAVVVLGVWLGYYVNWIQQRRALANRQNVAVSFIPARRPPSFGLWLLGERGATCVFLQYRGWLGIEWSEADEAQKAIASQLYPEARIEAWGGTIMPLDHPGSRISN